MMGTTCPSMHLTMYCRRMSPYLEKEKLLIHCFQDSLSGSVTQWYIQLSRVNIRTWRDLSRVFLEQYKHVTDMVSSRIALQVMEQRSNESFRQYAQRWRDVAAQVQPPLLESEVTPMFMETLPGPFYDHMLNHATKDFADMVLDGTSLEHCLTTVNREFSCCYEIIQIANPFYFCPRELRICCKGFYVILLV
ncbi:hypothetical protein GQ457_05G029270 [Hibiscus cannabinus]